MYKLVLNNELYHHGIKGQKWGVRRYQNEDGSLTNSGKKHYKKMLDKTYGTMNTDKQRKELYEKTLTKDQKQKLKEAADKAYKAHRKSQDYILKNHGYEDDKLDREATKTWLEYNDLGKEFAKQALGKYADKKDWIFQEEAYKRLGSIYYEQMQKDNGYDWYDHTLDDWDDE